MTKKIRLSALVFAAAALLVSAASAKVTENFSQTYPFAADGTISLSNVNGRVEIEAWDRNEVLLEFEKSATNDDALKRIRIEIDHSPTRLVIKTEHDKTWKLWDKARAEVRYTLKVPRGASLRKINAVNSSIRVSGVRGYVDLDTVNGSIKADGLAGGGRFNTVNGSVTASFVAHSDTDRIVVDTVNGSGTIELPSDAAFALKAGTVNGRVSCDFPLKLSDSSRRRLTGTVNDGSASVVLNSVNGALRIRAAD